jgi:hypothetical protein
VTRTVTLVLTGPDGINYGALEPFEVATSWWQDARSVVAAARAIHGIDVTILRILVTSRPRPPGGAISYLAEINGDPPDGLIPFPDRLVTEDSRRQSWARPGGPAADLAWADEQLSMLGKPRVGPAEQVRTWNLSSLWRLPTSGGGVWLKVVPSFFAHEGDIVDLVDIGPPLVAHQGPRMLLEEVPGADLHRPNAEQVMAMVRLLVAEQVRWFDRTDELLELGVPNWTFGPLSELVSDVVERTSRELDVAVATRATALVGGLDDRSRSISSCGIADTLVHGDFHDGNIRVDGNRMVLLDWGDCGIGHPLLDEAAAVDHLPATLADEARNAFVAAWHDAVPGSDPRQAAELLRPVAALRHAVINQRFLDNIEPAEHPFHRHDPVDWITRAVQ